MPVAPFFVRHSRAPRFLLSMNTTTGKNEAADHASRVRRGAIGIVERGSRLLVIRRALHIPKGGRWCFPGGHVEPGETAKVAVVREFREELAITVRPTQRLGAVRVLDTRHVLAVWRVAYLGGEINPSPAEVAEVRWMLPEELGAIPDGLTSNVSVLKMLKATR